MSSIGRAPSTRSSFRLQYWVDGRRKSRNFPTYEAAEAYALTLNEPIGAKRGPRTLSISDRIARWTERRANGCLLWTGQINNEGYGQLSVNGAMKLAHRVSYELSVAEIPPGLVIDHLCRVRSCIEPSHLEPVTQRENVLRSPVAPGALNAAKTHCPQGHPYSPENTYVYYARNYTERICKTCRSAYQKRRYEARKAV